MSCRTRRRSSHCEQLWSCVCWHGVLNWPSLTSFNAYVLQWSATSELSETWTWKRNKSCLTLFLEELDDDSDACFFPPSYNEKHTKRRFKFWLVRTLRFSISQLRVTYVNVRCWRRLPIHLILIVPHNRIQNFLRKCVNANVNLFKFHTQKIDRKLFCGVK